MRVSQWWAATDPMLCVRITTGVLPLLLYANSVRAVRFAKN